MSGVSGQNNDLSPSAVPYLPGIEARKGKPAIGRPVAHSFGVAGAMWLAAQVLRQRGAWVERII
jgi:hypothetical protein